MSAPPSVLLSEFAELPADAGVQVDWPTLVRVREAVAKALESLRDAGDIGSGLEATVTVYADGAVREALESLGDELRFVFITSDAHVAALADAPADAAQGEGFRVQVAASEHAKVHTLLASARRRRQCCGSSGNLRSLCRQYRGAGRRASLCVKMCSPIARMTSARPPWRCALSIARCVILYN